MNSRELFSFLLGLLILFGIYHFPEFFPLFWIMAVFKIGFILVAFIIGTLQGKKGLSGFGLGVVPGCWFDLLKGLLIGLFGFGISFITSILLGYEKIVLFPTAEVIFKQLPVLLLMTSIPSVAEDILTRGYLSGHLGKRLKKASWILISASVYVLNHIWRLNDGIAVITYLFLLGLLLAYVVWQTKSLWLAFGIHWGANIFFESTNSLMSTESIVPHQGSTWILAVIWGLVLLSFIVFPLINKPQT